MASLEIIKTKILGQTIHCTLKDGRTTEGTLICLDRLQNMILLDAMEERKVLKSLYDIDCDNSNNSKGDSTASVNDDGCEKKDEVKGEDANEEENDEKYYVFRRKISQVLIPGDQLVKVEVKDEILS